MGFGTASTVLGRGLTKSSRDLLLEVAEPVEAPAAHSRLICIPTYNRRLIITVFVEGSFKLQPLFIWPIGFLEPSQIDPSTKPAYIHLCFVLNAKPGVFHKYGFGFIF